MSDTSGRSRSPRTGQFQKGQAETRRAAHAANPAARGGALRLGNRERQAGDSLARGCRSRVVCGGSSAAPNLSGRTSRKPGSTACDLEDDHGARQSDRGQGTAKKHVGHHQDGERGSKKRRRRHVSSGIAAPDTENSYHPDALLLEPWAVQAALRRRRGSKALTTEDVDDIERSTRAPQTLRWPRRTKR